MRAAAAGPSWASVQGLSDEALDERLYGTKSGAGRPLPDCAYCHLERKKPGVTLELLHLEYLEKRPDGYRYTQFCERYRPPGGFRRQSPGRAPCPLTFWKIGLAGPAKPGF
jgi:transposase